MCYNNSHKMINWIKTAKSRSMRINHKLFEYFSAINWYKLLSRVWKFEIIYLV